MTAASYEVKDWVENTVTGRSISQVMEAINAEAKEHSADDVELLSEP
jgi:hypothetical protein